MALNARPKTWPCVWCRRGLAVEVEGVRASVGILFGRCSACRALGCYRADGSAGPPTAVTAALERAADAAAADVIDVQEGPRDA